MKRLLFGAFIFALLDLQIVLAHGATTEDLLPKVLIIGDSISIGYAPYVTQMMKLDAVVKHNQGNAQHTGTG